MNYWSEYFWSPQKQHWNFRCKTSLDIVLLSDENVETPEQTKKTHAKTKGKRHQLKGGCQSVSPLLRWISQVERLVFFQKMRTGRETPGTWWTDNCLNFCEVKKVATKTGNLSKGWRPASIRQEQQTLKPSEHFFLKVIKLWNVHLSGRWYFYCTFLLLTVDCPMVYWAPQPSP